MMSEGIVILGMHRSGTSALSGILAQLGADPGANLIPAEADVNAKGFWEHAEIVSTHDRLLAALGSSWHDERTLPSTWWSSPLMNPFYQEIRDICIRDFANKELWLLKDPRICRLAPLWLKVFQGLKCKPLFVLALRNPSEVAESLFSRNGISSDRSALLWLQHVLTAEFWTRNQPRVFCTFDKLLIDWRATIANIQSNLKFTFPIDNAALQSKIDDFLEPSMRHFRAASRIDLDGSRGRIRDLADDAWRALEDIDESGRHLKVLTKIRTEVASLEKEFASWSGEIQALSATNLRLANADLRNAELIAELDRIRSTVSWRVTKPLRVLANAPRFFRRSQR